MSGDTLKILMAMIGYMLVVIGIGLYFAKRAQANSENYFLGGRSLGPWVAAMSAEASDMSGWLLMGLPGVAYFSFVLHISGKKEPKTNSIATTKRIPHITSPSVPDFGLDNIAVYAV